MNGHINLHQVPVHFGILAGTDLSRSVRNASVSPNPSAFSAHKDGDPSIHVDVSQAVRQDLLKKHLQQCHVRDDILRKIELSVSMLMAGLHLFEDGKADQGSLVIKTELTRLQSAGMKLESVNTSINECAERIKKL